MARQPRLDLPDVPQHIVQRGNKQLTCFLDDDDRQRYLAPLREALLDKGCRMHAYVLMDNHVHLLAIPTEIGALMSTLWLDGPRFASCLPGVRYEASREEFAGSLKSELVLGFVIFRDDWEAPSPVLA